MGNIIQLREPLTFGKHAGLTGQQLLKSAEGTKYLVWIYNQTDIQMDMFVAEALIGAGLVKRNLERMNSRCGGGISKEQLYKDAKAHEMRVTINPEGEGNLSRFIRENDCTYLTQLIGRQVRVNVTPTPEVKAPWIKPVSMERGREIIEELRKEHKLGAHKEDEIFDHSEEIHNSFRKLLSRELRHLNPLNYNHFLNR